MLYSYYLKKDRNIMHFNFKWNWIALLLIVAFLTYKYAWPYYRHFQLKKRTNRVYALLPKDRVPWKIYGNSEKGHPIYYWQSGDTGTVTLIFGAFHGDEQSGFHLVKQLADTLFAHPDYIHKRVVLVPVVNPDGLLLRTRVNAHGVDINRNFPTGNWTTRHSKKRYNPGPKPASERETRLVMQMLKDFKPERIITIHDALRMNNYNGPARELAELLASFNGYRVTADVGYPTPGSFGNYGGEERQIPLVTLELPDIDPEQVWHQNGEALIAAINF